MKEKLKVIKDNNKIKIESNIINIDWISDTPTNRKVLIIFLRLLHKKKGEKYFSFKELSKIVNSENRQAASQYVEEFRNSCNKDLSIFLTKKKKLNNVVYEVVLSELLKEPMISTKELTIKTNQKLSRNDITETNIRTLLDRIPYGKIRKIIKKEIKSGKAHYNEIYLLKKLFNAEETKEKINSNINEKKVCVPRNVQKLLDSNNSVKDINPKFQIVIFCMTLYYYGVHLFVLGQWLNVYKTTVLRWIISLSESLWLIINNWVYKKIKSTTSYIDEKWIKIRGKWHYWFVVIDKKTEIPVFSKLLPSRSKWSCRWIGLKLKQLGRLPETIITDGLPGYSHIKNVKHLLCLFHYQQTITKWAKKHFTNLKELSFKKKMMKKTFQTKDKRTVMRRFNKLKNNAKKLGIEIWIKFTEKKLTKLLPVIGSKKFPTTSNCIERFFGNFNRFYKIRRGFHSIKSTKKELIFFLVMYLFIKQTNGKAPIEKIIPNVTKMPFYILVNNPIKAFNSILNVKLSDKMACFSESDSLLSLNT